MLLEPLGGVLEADEVRLKQVVLNLLSNAFKFTSGGTVRLEVAPDPEAPSEWMHIVVADTGIGVAPRHLEHLFEDFYQAEEVQRRSSGTGLGLAICHRLTTLMGGSIEAQSEVGIGSTFTVKLPLRTA